MALFKPPISYVQLIYNMAFFKKLFGGGGQTVQAPKQEPKVNSIPTAQKKTIDIEKAMEQLDTKIKEFQLKEQKLEISVETFRSKAKEKLQNGDKKAAKKFVEQATRIQKQVENITLRRKALVDKKAQLELTDLNMQAIEGVEVAHQFIKENEKYSEKLQDIILDSHDAKMHQDEITQKLKDLTGHDEEQEDIDDLMKQLEAEIKAQNMKEVGKKNVVISGQVSKMKSKNKQEDDIQKMLDQLG